MNCKGVLYFFLFISIIISACNGNKQDEESIYLFSYFKDEKSGMYLAVSEDGLNWNPLNQHQPVIKSFVGDSLLRDPSIVQDKSGRFHLLFTTSWTNLGFGYSSSKDLINWEKQQFIVIDKGELKQGARNAWAPELFYDQESENFYIIWATAKNHIPELKTGFKGDHKQYFIKTEDFKNYTEPKLLYGGHFSDKAIIDTYILQHEADYYFFYKVESTNLIDGGKDGIHFTWAPTLQGPYAPGKSIPNARGNAEGPAVIKVNNSWILYYDAPRGAASSKDLKNWTDISNQVNFPDSSRHGSILKVKKSILQESFGLSEAE